MLVVEDEEEETSDPTEAAEAAAEMGVAEEVEVPTRTPSPTIRGPDTLTPLL